MTDDTSRHELDDRLAGATMWAWYGPMFRLAFKHWPICLAAGLAALAIEWLVAALPWPFFPPWWVEVLRGYVELVAHTLVVIAAYRFLAERERVGTVNEWPTIVVRAVQIQTIWVLVGALILGVLALLALAVGLGARPSTVYAFAALGRMALVVGLVMFLLMPIWFSLAIASALSNVYAVRSSAGALSAVVASLRLAFDQKWRVFWPSYILFVLAIVIVFIASLVGAFLPIALQLTFGVSLAIVPTALAVPMTFVIERAYASHLTLPGGAGAGAELPSSPPPGMAPERRARSPAAPVTPLPTAPNEIADRIVEDLRVNRLQQFPEAVDAGLKADPRFFAAHPDETLAVAKRLAAGKRADLALRIVQPYLKEHRTHRQHLTVALYVANILLRDLGRKADAARFLAQVKALYPNEPMVDQLIKITDKAIAAEGAGAT